MHLCGGEIQLGVGEVPLEVRLWIQGAGVGGGGFGREGYERAYLVKDPILLTFCGGSPGKKDETTQATNAEYAKFPLHVFGQLLLYVGRPAGKKLLRSFFWLVLPVARVRQSIMICCVKHESRDACKRVCRSLFWSCFLYSSFLSSLDCAPRDGRFLELDVSGSVGSAPTQMVQNWVRMPRL